MSETEPELKKKNELVAPKKEDQIRSLESGKTSGVATERRSDSLSRDLSLSLMGLIDDVNKDGVTPESVNASCNAASQIYKILRLNFEMRKEGF